MDLLPKLEAGRGGQVLGQGAGCGQALHAGGPLQRRTPISHPLEGQKHQLCTGEAAPAVVRSSYRRPDAAPDAAKPVGSGGGGVGLEQELTACLCGDLQRMKALAEAPE